MNARGNDGERTIQSVDRAFGILDEIRRSREVTLSELAEGRDLSVGTLYVYLQTLCANGVVVENDRTYRLAPYLITLGEHVKNNTELYRIGRKVVDEIAYETGECAHLITEQDGFEVALYQSFGPDAVGTDHYILHQERPRWQLHWSASGKAILAHLSEEKIDRIVDDYELEARTQQTITNSDELFDELATTRERGYALNDEEEMSGVRAIAAPITDQYQNVLGSISISGPKSKLDDEKFYEELPEYILNKANVVEVELQASQFDPE